MAGANSGLTFSVMSYVVRQKSTGRYLQGRGQWTGNLENALQFNTGLSLVSYIDSGGARDGADTLEVLALPLPSGGPTQNAPRAG